jgi:hypothetical protein
MDGDLIEFVHFIEKYLPEGIIGRTKLSFDPRLIPQGRIGITIGHYVFIKPGLADIDLMGVIAHELKHVEQVERFGFAWFYIKYAWEYALHGYMKNKFEYEAYNFSTEMVKKFIQSR